MPYIVTTTSGTALATIPDNTVNTTTTSIALVGKNYAGYGAFLNENYIKILENFSNSIAPTTPLIGQLWFDSTNTLLKVWTGSDWKQMHGGAAQSTAPSGSIVGDLWWDTTNLVLKVWGGSAWVVIGPGASGSGGSSSGTSGSIVDTIIDTGSLSHAVLKLSIANQVIGIISKDAEFTPLTAIPGFNKITPGINLISSSTLSGSQFTGTASNALAINNISSTSFLTSVKDETTTHQLTVAKLQVGSDLLLDPTISGEVQIFSNGVGYKDLNLYINKSGVPTKALGITASTGAVTATGAMSVIGAFSASSTITATGAITSGGAVQAQSATTAIVNGGVNGQGDIGTSSKTFGTVYATVFNGASTTAKYADLAEIYATDEEYAIGTVVTVGGTAEVTAATYGDRAIGVISTNPAFLMNNAAKGQPIALKGRVPVKVHGTVKKGDKLVPAQNIYGAASTIVNHLDVNYFAIALEDNQQGSGVIECLIL